MAKLDKEFIAFFQELEQNNNKAWFDENRKRYETHVKKPFTALVQEMINRIGKYEDIHIQPADAMIRINNDIRFSKDKTVYKTHVGANISKFGKKNLGYPGFFFQISHNEIQMYGGVYQPEKEELYIIRALIASEPEDFVKAYNDKEFKAKFGDIQGEKMKRLPPEFQEAAKKEPYLFNKQFYYGATLQAKWITSEELPDKLMEYYLAANPVKNFLEEAF